jgi:hypothetical protein
MGSPNYVTCLLVGGILTAAHQRMRETSRAITHMGAEKTEGAARPRRRRDASPLPAVHETVRME